MKNGIKNNELLLNVQTSNKEEAKFEVMNKVSLNCTIIQFIFPAIVNLKECHTTRRREEHPAQKNV